MANIFVEADKDLILQRIGRVKTEGKRRWGQMTKPEMLVHCSRQLKLALGEISARSQGPWILHTRVGKWMAFSAIPWPRGTDTPKEMNLRRNSFPVKQVDEEITELLAYLKRVEESPALSPHPFFGVLSRQEWGRLIHKHLDHHLRQFGV